MKRNRHLITDRVRSTTVRYCFHRRLSVHTRGGGGTQRYLPPVQGTYPHPGPHGGYPRYLPPIQVPMGGRGTYPPSKVPSPVQVPTGGGIPQGTYPHPRYLPSSSRSRWEEGVPRGTYPPSKVSTHPAFQDRTA